LQITKQLATIMNNYLLARLQVLAFSVKDANRVGCQAPKGFR
jgi:hypothetical protein